MLVKELNIEQTDFILDNGFVVAFEDQTEIKIASVKEMCDFIVSQDLNHDMVQNGSADYDLRDDYTDPKEYLENNTDSVTKLYLTQKAA